MTPSVEHVRRELARRSGLPVTKLTDDLTLVDVGIDSLVLVEVLLEAVGDDAALDDLDDQRAVLELPWLETVGELTSFVATLTGGQAEAPAASGLSAHDADG